MATYTLMLLTSLFFAALVGYRLYHTRERSYARRMRREARAYAGNAGAAARMSRKR